MRDQRRSDWFLRSAVCGAIAGFAFVVFFVRLPRWARHFELDELLIGIIGIAFIAGGGYVGFRLYERYGCRFGLHTWVHHRLPEMRDCMNCKREFRPVYDSDNKRILRWEEGQHVRDEVTGRIKWITDSPMT